MKKILFILAFLIAAAAFSQVIPVDVLNRNGLTTVQMNSVTVADGLVEGSEIRNTDTGTIWRYNGTIWEDTGSGGGSSYTFTSPIEESTGTVSLNMSAFDWTGILGTYPNLDIDSTDDGDSPFTETVGASNIRRSPEPLISESFFIQDKQFPTQTIYSLRMLSQQSTTPGEYYGLLELGTGIPSVSDVITTNPDSYYWIGNRNNVLIAPSTYAGGAPTEKLVVDGNVDITGEYRVNGVAITGGGTDDQDATEVPTVTTNFDGVLGATEDTVQKALDVLDDASTGSLTTEQTERIANANKFDPNIKTADNIPWASDDVEKQSVGDRGTRSAYSITNGATYTVPMTDAFIALQLAAKLPLLSAPFDGTAINTLEVGTIYQFKDFAGNTGDVWTVTNDVKSGVIIGTDIYVDGGTVSTASTVPELFVTANAASDPNGNETDGTAGWTGIGASVASESTDADLNGFTIVITANQNDGNDMGRYTQTGLDPAKTYVLEFRAKRTGTDSSLQLLAAELDGSQILTSINSATYTDYSVEFDPSGTSIDFRFAVNLQNGIGSIGDILKISQISLKEKVN